MTQLTSNRIAVTFAKPERQRRNPAFVLSPQIPLPRPMDGPDGTDYKNESVFREIEQPARIVFDHVSSPRFRVVATFDAECGKTRVTFRMIFESVEALERVKSFVPECNEQNFDRLAVQLALL